MQDDFIRDRGNIKWTAMMLPEHRVALHDWGMSQHDVDPPLKDEDELTELAEILTRAMQDGELVTVCYWKNKRDYEITGIVKKIDPYKKAILIDATVGDDWDQRWVPANYICSMEINEPSTQL